MKTRSAQVALLSSLLSTVLFLNVSTFVYAQSTTPNPTTSPEPTVTPSSSATPAPTSTPQASLTPAPTASPEATPTPNPNKEKVLGAADELGKTGKDIDFVKWAIAGVMGITVLIFGIFVSRSNAEE